MAGFRWSEGAFAPHGGIEPACVRFSGAAMKAGIEARAIEQAPVRIYSVAKMVADCFKYRNKIGIDVAIEAVYFGGAD